MYSVYTVQSPEGAILLFGQLLEHGAGLVIQRDRDHLLFAFVVAEGGGLRALRVAGEGGH